MDDQEDGDALFHAVERGDQAEVERLLQAGADPDVVHDTRRFRAKGGGMLSERNGVTGPIGQVALHSAVWDGHVELAEVLLRHGSTVDMRTDSGDMTPLMFAILGPYEDPQVGVHLVRLLIAHGADLYAEYDGSYPHESPWGIYAEAWQIAESGHFLTHAPGGHYLTTHPAVKAVLQAWLRWRRIEPKVRFVGRIAATLIHMMHESAERAYSPSEHGFEEAAASFQTCCEQQV